MRSGLTGGISGFLLKELDGEVLAARWAEYPFHPASSIKVIHYLHVFLAAGDSLDEALDLPVRVFLDSCADSGASRQEPLGDLMNRMMIESDNQAANALQGFFGVGPLQATAEAVGMTATKVHHRFGCGGRANDPANHSTIIDLVSLYEEAAAGRLLPPWATERFFDGMLDITGLVLSELAIDQRPPEIRIVAKAGRNDHSLSLAGVAELTSGTFVFGVFVDRAHGILEGFTLERVLADLLRDIILPHEG